MFKEIKELNYEDYWKIRGAKLRKKLMDREFIFMKWIKDGSAVLNIACGNSSFLLELKKRKGCQVEGFDISSLVVEEQKRADIEACVKDINNKEFKIDKNYDYIILSEILEHLALPENLISKIKNRTKFLLISIPNSVFYRFRFSLFFKGRFFKQWFYHPSEHLRFWSHLDFKDWLDGLGLEIIKYEAANGLDIGPIKIFKFWPNLFGHQICYLVKNKK